MPAAALLSARAPTASVLPSPLRATASPNWARSLGLEALMWPTCFNGNVDDGWTMGPGMGAGVWGPCLERCDCAPVSVVMPVTTTDTAKARKRRRMIMIDANQL